MSFVKFRLIDEEIYLEISIFNSEGGYVYHFFEKMTSWTWIRIDKEGRYTKIRFNIDSIDPVTFFILPELFVWQNNSLDKPMNYCIDPLMEEHLKLWVDKIVERFGKENEIMISPGAVERAIRYYRFSSCLQHY